MADFYNFINKTETETDLYITGDIVDDNMEWVYDWYEQDCVAPKKFKAELDKHKGKKINVIIDSNGGSVFAASTIYTALREHTGEVVCKISSIAASAASVIAMAGDKVYISPTAMLMIHNPLTYVEGNQHDLRHSADILDSIKESIINAYERKTHLSREKISKLMDKESWFDANEAIELGFADGIIGEENNTNNSNLFDKAFLENIKNQKIAVYNAFKPQNQAVKPQEPITNVSEPIEENKPTESEIKAVQAKLKLLALKKRF